MQGNKHIRKSVLSFRQNKQTNRSRLRFRTKIETANNFSKEVYITHRNGIPKSNGVGNLCNTETSDDDNVTDSETYEVVDEVLEDEDVACTPYIVNSLKMNNSFEDKDSLVEGQINCNDKVVSIENDINAINNSSNGEQSLNNLNLKTESKMQNPPSILSKCSLISDVSFDDSSNASELSDNKNSNEVCTLKLMVKDIVKESAGNHEQSNFSDDYDENTSVQLSKSLSPILVQEPSGMKHVDKLSNLQESKKTAEETLSAIVNGATVSEAEIDALLEGISSEDSISKSNTNSEDASTPNSKLILKMPSFFSTDIESSTEASNKDAENSYQNTEVLNKVNNSGNVDSRNKASSCKIDISSGDSPKTDDTSKFSENGDVIKNVTEKKISDEKSPSNDNIEDNLKSNDLDDDVEIIDIDDDDDMPICNDSKKIEENGVLSGINDVNIKVEEVLNDDKEKYPCSEISDDISKALEGIDDDSDVSKEHDVSLKSSVLSLDSDDINLALEGIDDDGVSDKGTLGTKEDSDDIATALEGIDDDDDDDDDDVAIISCDESDDGINLALEGIDDDEEDEVVKCDKKDDSQCSDDIANALEDFDSDLEIIESLEKESDDIEVKEQKPLSDDKEINIDDKHNSGSINDISVENKLETNSKDDACIIEESSSLLNKDSINNNNKERADESVNKDKIKADGISAYDNKEMPCNEGHDDDDVIVLKGVDNGSDKVKENISACDNKEKPCSESHDDNVIVLKEMDNDSDKDKENISASDNKEMSCIESHDDDVIVLKEVDNDSDKDKENISASDNKEMPCSEDHDDVIILKGVDNDSDKVKENISACDNKEKPSSEGSDNDVVVLKGLDNDAIVLKGIDNEREKAKENCQLVKFTESSGIDTENDIVKKDEVKITSASTIGSKNEKVDGDILMKSSSKSSSAPSNSDTLKGSDKGVKITASLRTGTDMDIVKDSDKLLKATKSAIITNDNDSTSEENDDNGKGLSSISNENLSNQCKDILDTVTTGTSCGTNKNKEEKATEIIKDLSVGTLPQVSSSEKTSVHDKNTIEKGDSRVEPIVSEVKLDLMESPVCPSIEKPKVVTVDIEPLENCDEVVILEDYKLDKSNVETDSNDKDALPVRELLKEGNISSVNSSKSEDKDNEEFKWDKTADGDDFVFCEVKSVVKVLCNVVVLQADQIQTSERINAMESVLHYSDLEKVSILRTDDKKDSHLENAEESSNSTDEDTFDSSKRKSSDPLTNAKRLKSDPPLDKSDKISGDHVDVLLCDETLQSSPPSVAQVDDESSAASVDPKTSTEISSDSEKSNQNLDLNVPAIDQELSPLKENSDSSSSVCKNVNDSSTECEALIEEELSSTRTLQTEVCATASDIELPDNSVSSDSTNDSVSASSTLKSRKRSFSNDVTDDINSNDLDIEKKDESPSDFPLEDVSLSKRLKLDTEDVKENVFSLEEFAEFADELILSFCEKCYQQMVSELTDKLNKLKELMKTEKLRIDQGRSNMRSFAAKQGTMFERTGYNPKIEKRTVGVNVRILPHDNLKQDIKRKLLPPGTSISPAKSASLMVVPPKTMQPVSRINTPVTTIASTLQSGKTTVLTLPTSNKVVVNSSTLQSSITSLAQAATKGKFSPNKSSSTHVVDLTDEDSPTRPKTTSATTMMQRSPTSTPPIIPPMMQLVPTTGTVSGAGTGLRVVRPPAGMTQVPRFTTYLVPQGNMSLLKQVGSDGVSRLMAPRPLIPGNPRQPLQTYVLAPMNLVSTLSRSQPLNSNSTIASGTTTTSVLGSSQVTLTPCSSQQQHPAPLPPASGSSAINPKWKDQPPRPTLKLTRSANGIILSWTLNLNTRHADIAQYQLYAYQETKNPPNQNLWKKVGDIKALPLPMACTLTQFAKGQKYYFTVRAIDVHKRMGPFSEPATMLPNDETPPEK